MGLNGDMETLLQVAINTKTGLKSIKLYLARTRFAA